MAPRLRGSRAASGGKNPKTGQLPTFTRGRVKRRIVGAVEAAGEMSTAS